jgi:hypothetical protein
VRRGEVSAQSEAHSRLQRLGVQVKLGEQQGKPQSAFYAPVCAPTAHLHTILTLSAHLKDLIILKLSTHGHHTARAHAYATE